MEMVENEREIRKELIAKSKKNTEELYRMGKEAAESLEGMVRDKELSRSTKKELIRYGRYLEEMKKFAENLKEFNTLLTTTQAERAEPKRENDQNK